MVKAAPELFAVGAAMLELACGCGTAHKPKIRWASRGERAELMAEDRMDPRVAWLEATDRAEQTLRADCSAPSLSEISEGTRGVPPAAGDLPVPLERR